MKRLNRDMEAVSPVIATILMVAITVVLAATLYMMVGDIGGDGGVSSLSASITQHDGTTMEIVSMSSPGEANIDEIQITVLTTDDEYSGTIPEADWNLVDTDDDGNVMASGGSRFDFNSTGLENGDNTDINTALSTGGTLDYSDIDEVVLEVDGYDGTANYADF